MFAERFDKAKAKVILPPVQGKMNMQSFARAAEFPAQHHSYRHVIFQYSHLVSSIIVGVSSLKLILQDDLR